MEALRSELDAALKQVDDLQMQLRLSRAGLPALGVVQFDSDQTSQLREELHQAEKRAADVTTNWQLASAAAAGWEANSDRFEAERDALRAQISRVVEWTHQHGEALKPRRADTYGEGMRDAKAQVSNMITSGRHG